MRVVHVANFYGAGSGGVRTFMHAVAQGYQTAGHTPILVVPGAEPDDEETPSGRRVTVQGPRLPFSGGYRIITNLTELKRTIEALEPDRLEVSDRLSLRSLGYWARQRSIPTLCFAHERVDGVLKAHAKMPDRLAVRLADAHNKATAEAFDTMVCTTGFAAEEFQRIGVRNIERVPLGVDTTTFHPSRWSQDVRDKFVGRDDILLVMCSRLSGEKRPDIAVLALAELRRRGLAVRLVVAGTGPKHVERRVRRLAADLPVTFVGFLPDRHGLAALLATADVVIAPGPIETFGLAACEALASGTPVVGAASSALAEIITADAGRVTATDPSAVADAVEDILSQAVVQRRAGARVRAENFSWSTSVERLLTLHGVPPVASEASGQDQAVRSTTPAPSDESPGVGRF